MPHEHSTSAGGAIVTSSRLPAFGTLVRRYGTLFIFVLLVVIASAISPDFLTWRNVMNLLRQSSTTVITAVGMLFVVLTRGIDLSVGSVLAVGCVLVAIMVQSTGLPAALLITLGAGALCGAVCGGLIAFGDLPSFVVTLAMMTIARGFAFMLTDGQPIMMNDPGLPLTNLASGSFLQIPYLVWLAAGIVIVGWFVLSRTSFGRIVKAIGSNEEAVRLSGIRVERYVTAVYIIAAILASLSGIISSARTGIGAPNVGIGFELEVIAAVVIGGASLMGGRGDIPNTVLGALTLAIIGNIMNLSDVPGYTQEVVMGVIIIIAIGLQRLQRRKSR